jgi:hypothetical protein
LEARQEGTIRTVLDTSQREVDEIKTVPPPKFNTQLKEKGEDFPCSWDIWRKRIHQHAFVFCCCKKQDHRMSQRSKKKKISENRRMDWRGGKSEQSSKGHEKAVESRGNPTFSLSKWSKRMKFFSQNNESFSISKKKKSPEMWNMRKTVKKGVRGMNGK